MKGCVDTGRARGRSSSSMCVCVCVCVCIYITTACVYNRTGEGEELMKYLRALLLSQEDLTLADSESTTDAHQLVKSRVFAGSAVSLENECRAWRVLAAGFPFSFFLFLSSRGDA